MERYSILLGYFDKQLALLKKLYNESVSVDVKIYDKRFLFAMRTQQFYTALEDLFKQIAKSFENHIEDLSSYHKELLVRLNTEIPKIRPAVISDKSLLLLDKIRAFRHFVRHAYDCELDENELAVIQKRLKNEFSDVKKELVVFKKFVQDLSK